MRDPADRFLDLDGASFGPPDEPDPALADLVVYVVIVGEASLGFAYNDTFAALAFNHLPTAAILAQALDGRVFAMRLGMALEKANAMGAVLCVVDEVNGLLLQFLHGEKLSPTVRTRPLTAREQVTLKAMTMPCGKG
jgi:hypothetical protein